VFKVISHKAASPQQTDASVVFARWCKCTLFPCLSVGLSVTLVSPAQTAGPIEMPFELWTRVGQGTMY